jgi:hypothetical protein
MLLFYMVKSLRIWWINWLLFTNSFGSGVCITFLGMGGVFEQLKYCFSDESVGTLPIPTVPCVRQSWTLFQIIMRTHWYSHESHRLWWDTSHYRSLPWLLNIRKVGSVELPLVYTRNFWRLGCKAYVRRRPLALWQIIGTSTCQH